MLSKVDILKDKILNDIRSGRLRPGDALPSRHQFMRRFGCARGSIDSAISELTRDGFVYSRQGAGTYVADPADVGEIKQVYLIDNSLGSMEGLEAAHSGFLAAEIQQRIPCYVFHSEDVGVNLLRIMRPGHAVIWMRPPYAQFMTMSYLSNGRIPQLLIGRTYGDFDYITTDANTSIRTGLEWLSTRFFGPVAFVSMENNPDLPYIAERQLAFYENCLKLGLQMSPDLIFSVPKNASPGALSKVASRLFVGENAPSRIFISTIAHVMPLVSLGRAHGKEPGRDYALLMFDTTPELEGVNGVGSLKQCWPRMWQLAKQWVVDSRPRAGKNMRMKIPAEFVVS